MAVTISNPFVGTVCRLFDKHTDAETLPHSTNPPVSVVDSLPSLIPNVRGLVAEYSGSNIASWLHLTCTFDPTDTNSRTEEAIENAAKNTLQTFHAQTIKKLDVLPENPQPHVQGLISRLRLEIQRDTLAQRIAATERSLTNPFPAKAKTVLLTHVFETAFRLSNTEEKQEILTALESHKTRLEASYSRIQRIGISISESVSSVFRDDFARTLVLLFLSSRICLFVKTIFPFISLKPLIAFSPLVFKYASIAAIAFGWIIAHQFFLACCSLIGFEILMSLGVRQPTRILLLPVLPSFIIGHLLSLITGIGTRDPGTLGNTLLNYSNAKRQTYNTNEEQKALRLWLRMAELVAEQRRAVEVKTPAQPINQA